MKASAATVAIDHVIVGRALRAIRLENSYLTAVLLIDQGGDILELTHKPTAIDVLWKVPYPVREPGVGPVPSGDSFAQWINYYRGGWQTIFPNYGSSVSFRGSQLDFHGEAARRPWTIESKSTTPCIEIELSTRLACLPLSLRRKISLSEERAEISIIETVTNLSGSPIDCMWAHHPVFGAPFLCSESRIYTGARLVHTDPAYDVPGNDLKLGEISEWPFATSKTGTRVDLSRVPPADSGFSRVVFLKQFEEPWCAIVNPVIPLGVALSWNGDLMKYLCLWQETGGERDFPHFAKTYTTALEPATSLFGHGLLDAIQKTRTHLTLRAGESRTLYLKATLFEDRRRVTRVSAKGAVEFVS